ncbi:repair helicase [Methanolobus psychrophilus R15]|nr:repair helicase [Methanolobus psychrophilus R15]
MQTKKRTPIRDKCNLLCENSNLKRENTEIDYGSTDIVGAKTQVVYGTAGTGKTTWVRETFYDEVANGNRCRVFSHSNMAVSEYGEDGQTIQSQCAQLTGDPDGSYIKEKVLMGLYAKKDKLDLDYLVEMAYDRKYSRQELKELMKVPDDVCDRLKKTEFGASVQLWNRIRNSYMGEVFDWRASDKQCVPSVDGIKSIYRSIIKDHGGHEPTYKSYTNDMTRSSEHGLSVNAFIKHAIAYENWKSEHGFIDYTDTLVEVAVEGYTPDENIIIIDEANDLTPLQWMIVSNWIASPTVTRAYIVGDVAQCVFSFQGTSPDELLEFPRYRTDCLDTIYRYGQNIWADAKWLIPYTRAPYNVDGINPLECNDDEVINVRGERGFIDIMNSFSGKEIEKAAFIAPTNAQVARMGTIMRNNHDDPFHPRACDTFHGAKGGTFELAISNPELPNYWVKQAGSDKSQLASLDFVGRTRARKIQINVRGLFNKGYVDLDKLVFVGADCPIYPRGGGLVPRRYYLLTFHDA